MRTKPLARPLVAAACAALLAAPVHAGEPARPPVLKALETQGLTVIQEFNVADGLRGFAGAIQERPVAIYVTPDGTAIVGTRAVLDPADAAQLALLEASGARMLQARDDVLALRARVGVSQNAVERAKAERVSERDTLDLARARMVTVDQAEAASNYQAHKVQLEALYVVMANLSELRFSNYMR